MHPFVLPCLHDWNARHSTRDPFVLTRASVMISMRQ
jgi:hypothetical protein